MDVSFPAFEVQMNIRESAICPVHSMPGGKGPHLLKTLSGKDASLRVLCNRGVMCAPLLGGHSATIDITSSSSIPVAASMPGNLCSNSECKSAVARRVLTQQVSTCWLLAAYEARDGYAGQQRLSTEDCCSHWAIAPKPGPAIMSHFPPVTQKAVTPTGMWCDWKTSCGGAPARRRRFVG